jgi:hypothetical protein
VVSIAALTPAVHTGASVAPSKLSQIANGAHAAA